MRRLIESPEARALAGRLGGEERLEEPRAQLGRDPRAIVRLPARRPRPRPRRARNGHGPPLALERFGRILEQVEEHLIQGPGIAREQRQILGDLDPAARRRASREDVPHELEGRFEPPLRRPPRAASPPPGAAKSRRSATRRGCARGPR